MQTDTPTSAWHKKVAALTESERQELFAGLQKSISAAKEKIAEEITRIFTSTAVPLPFTTGDSEKAITATEKLAEAWQSPSYTRVACPNLKAGMALLNYLEQAANDPIIQESSSMKEIADFLRNAVGNIGVTDTVKSMMEVQSEPYIQEARTREAKASAAQRNANAMAWVRSEWRRRKDEVKGNKSEFVRRLKGGRYQPPFQVSLPSDHRIKNMWLKSE